MVGQKLRIWKGPLKNLKLHEIHITAKLKSNKVYKNSVKIFKEVRFLQTGRSLGLSKFVDCECVGTLSRTIGLIECFYFTQIKIKE